MKKLICILLAVVALLVMTTPVMAVTIGTDVTLSGTVYTNSMNLENKNFATDWSVKVDGIGGTLGYNASGPTFVWGLVAQGVADGEYALIYYADKPNRFVNWGGNNPGAVIGIVNAVGGMVNASGSTELNMDLPCPPDTNLTDYASSGYSAPGAKIWLVPSSLLTGGALPLNAWTPNDSWLFETDLITYDDTDVVSLVVGISVAPANINFGLLIQGQTANGGNVVITNTGTVPCTVTASVPATNVFQYLLLDGAAVSAYNSGSLAVAGTDTVAVTLPVPASYPVGAETNTLTFTASP